MFILVIKFGSDAVKGIPGAYDWVGPGIGICTARRRQDNGGILPIPKAKTRDDAE